MFPKLGYKFIKSLDFYKQWVFDNRFAVDYSFGFGYGITSNSKDNFLGSLYQYGFSIEPNTGLAWTSNFKLAYLF